MLSSSEWMEELQQQTKYIFHTFPSAENITKERKLLPCKQWQFADSVISELQAGFLITNAVRFIFKAPGIASWQYTLLQLQVKECVELHYTFPPQSTTVTDSSATCFIPCQHPVHTGSRSSEWSKTITLPWPFFLDCSLICLLSLLPCMYMSTIYFAFKL